MQTIEGLRKIAELNLSPECYKVYLALLEPGIRAMLSEYFQGWQGVEMTARFMLRKVMKVYRSGPPYLIDSRPGEDLNEHADDLDLKSFHKITYLDFNKVLKELRDKRVIGDNLYGFLHELNRRRNKVHRFNAEINEKERLMFESAYGLLTLISHSMNDPGLWGTNTDKMRQDVERRAAELLSHLNSE